MPEKYKYDMRGVSATKGEVHEAIKHLDKGLYPSAFCKILPDIVAGDPDFCNLMHADTAGTKTSVAYMYWRETGNLDVWKGIAQDAIVMNLDDMACVGAIDNIVLSSTIGRNKRLVSGEVISTIINASNQFLQMLNDFGVGVYLAGGETADVGDIVRTIDVGYTAFARMRRDDVIVNDIKAGDVIVGLASYGKASYEENYNSGMGSNGLTSARHDVLNYDYADMFPESYDDGMPMEVAYMGMQKLTDPIELEGVDEDLDVGKLILSPTRTYLPVLIEILKSYRKVINGMIHCTGRGQTKVLKFISNKHVIKDNLFLTPFLFEMIRDQAETRWQEMYQVFNMGHRMEVYLPEKYAGDIIQISKSFNIDAQIIGRVEDFKGEKVTIQSPYGKFVY